MKAWLCHSPAEIYELKLQSTAMPSVAADQVLIKVKYLALNFPSLLMLKNKYQVRPPVPFAPCGEIFGEVVHDCHSFKKGDLVVAFCSYGGAAVYVSTLARRTIKVPNEDIGLKYLAGFYNYSTAYYALKNRAQITAEDTIYINGAGGGVGLAAVEIAHKLGARVIAGASNLPKLRQAKAAGADEVINYSKENVLEKVMNLTQQTGVSVVMDLKGGEHTATAFSCLAHRGRFLVVGFASGQIAGLQLNKILLKNAHVMGISISQEASTNAALFLENGLYLLDEVSNGNLQPVIHHVYSFSDLPLAFKTFERSEHIGKILVKVPS